MLAPRPQKLLSSVPADVSTRTRTLDHLIRPTHSHRAVPCSVWHIQTRCVGLNRECGGSRTDERWFAIDG